MALYDGYKNVENSRSNTALVRSGHMSPADKWLVDKAFTDGTMEAAFPGGYLFNYQYGGPGMEEVVLPKGRVVGVGPVQKDFVSKKALTTITLPGMATNNNVIGMLPYNVTKDMTQMDRFGGNQASVITLEYVNLPYMPGVAAEATMDKAHVITEEQRISGTNKMPWGAVIGTGLKEGDYVKATPSGRLTKWNPDTDKFHQVVGQVYAVDFNAEPTGWLKWMLWDESARKEDDVYMNRSGASNLPSDGGYPYDPTYSEGNTNFQQYQSRLISEPSGIPGLHDGALSAKTEHTKTFDVQSGQIACQLTDYAGMPVGHILDVKVATLTQADPGNAADVDESGLPKQGKFTINTQTGMVMFNVLDVGEKTITYSFKRAGIKTGMDFTGVVGEVHVLLMK